MRECAPYPTLYNWPQWFSDIEVWW